jgi:hypothetical protein
VQLGVVISNYNPDESEHMQSMAANTAQHLPIFIFFFGNMNNG